MLSSLLVATTVRSVLLTLVVAASLVACDKHQAKKAAPESCPPVAGIALTIETVLLTRPESPRQTEGVLDSQDALAASGYQLQGEARAVRPPGFAALAERDPFDFGKRRIAFTTVRQNVNAIWVVETPTEIVVGLRVEAYCGGAAPPDSLVAAVVPASSKPVRFARCSVGACDGVLRP